jgi:hypothetical protein
MRCRPDPARLVMLAALACGLLALPGPATAAKLLGGRQQAAVRKAFFRARAHRGKLITSIRASSISSSWAVVRWTEPTSGGDGQTAPSLHSAYYHRGPGGESPGQPPAKVARELSSPFRVTLLYTGSGTESVSYEQRNRSVCDGGGGFVESQQDSVSPLSWTVRYTVELDRILSAVRGAQGAVIVPATSFDASRSRLRATERTSRTYVDQGCFSHPTNYACVTTFHVSGAGGANGVSFLPGLGAEIGIPIRSSGRGQCSAEYYNLGPSLWDSGGATALVGALRLDGGHLPGNPYAPLRVSWPGNSAALQEGFLASPCSGIATGCTDVFRWHGTVRLQPFGAK